MSKLNLETRDWIAWLGATLVACATLSATLAAYAYTNFQTKDEAKHVEQFLVERLNRIEEKLDRVIERR